MEYHWDARVQSSIDQHVVQFYSQEVGQFNHDCFSSHRGNHSLLGLVGLAVDRVVSCDCHYKARRRNCTVIEPPEQLQFPLSALSSPLPPQSQPQPQLERSSLDSNDIRFYFRGTYRVFIGDSLMSEDARVYAMMLWKHCPKNQFYVTSSDFRHTGEYFGPLGNKRGNDFAALCAAADTDAAMVFVRNAQLRSFDSLERLKALWTSAPCYTSSESRFAAAAGAGAACSAAVKTRLSAMHLKTPTAFVIGTFLHHIMHEELVDYFFTHGAAGLFEPFVSYLLQYAPLARVVIRNAVSIRGIDHGGIFPPDETPAFQDHFNADLKMYATANDFFFLDAARLLGEYSVALDLDAESLFVAPGERASLAAGSASANETWAELFVDNFHVCGPYLPEAWITVLLLSRFDSDPLRGP